MCPDRDRAEARRRLPRFLTSPWLHVSWAAVVALALAISYPVDPYVFGITTLALCWVTAVLSPIGVIAALAARNRSWPVRVAILVSALLSAGLVGMALLMLRSFSWT
jgi:uncharacterized YccA/Bax inhibitor family protein